MTITYLKKSPKTPSTDDSKKILNNNYDAVIVAVRHDKIKKIGLNKIIKVSKKNVILIDIFNLFKSKTNKFEL